MLSREPKVSVIMPSYNKAAYIGKTIESVINQSYKNWELIIVDDSSTDDSLSVISEYKDERIKVTKNEVNMGIADTRNKALSLAEGEYIAVLDADDISPAYRFEHEVDFLNQNRDISVVYGGCQEIDAEGNNGKLYISAFHNPGFVKANLLIGNVIPNSSAMYRKLFVMENFISYKNDLCGMDDYLFWIECAAKGKIAGMPETMLYWRNLKDNATAHSFSGENGKRRERIYSQIHEEALRLFGFDLEDGELEIYNRNLKEKQTKLLNHDEMKKFLQVMRKLCGQAEGKKEMTEYVKVFRREFGRILENSYIWD